MLLSGRNGKDQFVHLLIPHCHSFCGGIVCKHKDGAVGTWVEKKRRKTKLGKQASDDKLNSFLLTPK